MMNKGNKFSITLNVDWFQPENVLYNTKEFTCVIVDNPVHRYYKWYHKILYYICFKRRFIETWAYPIRIKEQDQK